ncbi:hypothetical protein LCGC14_1332760 [marine sediment metagenome]|uniref:Uncharacterized protein n=1 Tax=marine sediment metagenome TaxID=412755 RepID=A0A0F9L233_9ZZZZ
MVITSPVGTCTGWSIWSIYDYRINLANVSEDSGADFIYLWNNTGQEWIAYTSADTSKGSHNLQIGDAVHLYENTNNTWFRNNSGTPSYFVNITGGHVYFGLYNEFSFGNISHGLFLNTSGGNVTSNGSAAYLGDDSVGGLEFQIDFLSSYNNSGHFYVDAVYQWTWNNDTILGKSYRNGLDTLWAWSGYNLTINVTHRGAIIGNWSI